MSQQIEIPRYVDEPPHILMWSADEAAPIMICFIFGILTSQILLSLAVGIVFTKLYSRFRDGRPDGYILHLLYWYGFMPSRARSAPNPYATRFDN